MVHASTLIARLSTMVASATGQDRRAEPGGRSLTEGESSPPAHGSTRRDEQGQGMVEYALILVLIAVVVIVVLSVVGNQVNNVFSNVSNGLGQ
jgi:pilus assembly protein Flp/PilA